MFLNPLITARMVHPHMEAIRANPEDNLPRLVFADWLDEHNAEDYAYLIRQSIAAGTLDSKAERTLYKLVFSLKELVPYWQGRVKIDRGFICSVTANVMEYDAVDLLYPQSVITKIRIPNPYHIPHYSNRANIPEHLNKWAVDRTGIPYDVYRDNFHELNQIVEDYPGEVLNKEHHAIIKEKRRRMDAKLNVILLKHARNTYLKSINEPI